MRWVLIFLLFVLTPAWADIPVEYQICDLPPEYSPEDATQRYPAYAPFMGIHSGKWNDSLPSALIGTSVEPGGIFIGFYFHGAYEAAGIETEGCVPLTGRIVGKELKAEFANGAKLVYKIEEGYLSGTYSRRRTAQGRFFRSGETGAQEKRPDRIQPLVKLIETELVEDGKPVRLEVVMYRPPTPGPHPLLVFNHGSTGSGNRPSSFTKTRFYEDVADFFVNQGWMVAIPHRRGRGGSDGLYDEGFWQYRAAGYTCVSEIAIKGAERALEDIEAAIAALQRDPAVDDARIVIGGQSRGGVLSVAYSGSHTSQIKGVINFVGGWLARSCPTASEVNQALFLKGSSYPRETLWLYGERDHYYPIKHSRGNFDAFVKAGGSGAFKVYKVTRGVGHKLHKSPHLWGDEVLAYLGRLDLLE